jgi:hypothetical protein
MSYQAMRWAMYDAPMLLLPSGKPDVTARLVLLVRAERASEDGRDTYAAHDEIRLATGCDIRTIQRAERRLEEAGLMVRDGFSRYGTPRWHLDLKQTATSAYKALADAAAARRRASDAERKRRQREREKGAGDAQSIDGHVRDKITVTDSAPVTSRTLNPDVTDSVTGCHGLNATRTTLRTTPEPPQGTALGGTLPPSPLRPPSPSAPGTYSHTSLAESLTQAQDQLSDPLPHASAMAAVVELRPGISQEAPYRPAPQWTTSAMAEVAAAAQRRAARRAEYQAQLAADKEAQ